MKNISTTTIIGKDSNETLEIIENLEKIDALRDENILLFTAASISDYVINKLLAKEGMQGLLKKPLRLVDLTDAFAA